MSNMIYGHITRINGEDITIKLEEPVSIYRKHNEQGMLKVGIEFLDSRTISRDQQKKIRAILSDIAEYSGYTADETSVEMKQKFIEEENIDFFSLSNCSMSLANDYLSWLLDFCFFNDVGFKTKTWDVLPNDYANTLRCIKYRKCIICGQHADIDHTEGLVGIGRNRKLVNNSSSYFLPLCRRHHFERHNKPILDFLNKYHIKPIKLDLETRRKLHVGNN